jgi:hypothetical protein
MTDKTREVLAEMLKENTGRSILDSGDFYGRHYERNANRDFESEQPTSLRFKSYRAGEVDINVTANLYHWLAERLEYCPEWDKRFLDYTCLSENEDESWLSLAENFGKYLKEQKIAEEVGGIYGDDEPVTFNTYNGDDLLSQVIQYVHMEIDGEPLVLLQIHQGADVRGGYTRPRAFICNEPEGLFGNADATISCENGHNWTTDDAGYHWYYDGSTRGMSLKDYAVLTDEEIADEDNPPEEYQRYLREKQIYDEWKAGQQLLDGFPEPKVVVGFLRVDEDGNGYCPECGSILSAWT